MTMIESFVPRRTPRNTQRRLKSMTMIESFVPRRTPRKTQRMKSMTMAESFVTATREERAQRADTRDSLVEATREERAQKATPTTINKTKDRPCLLKSLRYNTILPYMPSARLEVTFWSITIIIMQNSKSKI